MKGHKEKAFLSEFRDEDQSWGTRTQVGTLLLELRAWREEGLLQCSRITVKVGSRVEIRAGKKKKYLDSSRILPMSPFGQIYQNPVGRADKEI